MKLSITFNEIKNNIEQHLQKVREVTLAVSFDYPHKIFVLSHYLRVTLLSF